MLLLLHACGHLPPEPDFGLEVDVRTALAAPDPSALTTLRATLDSRALPVLSFDDSTARLLWEQDGIRSVRSVALADLDPRPTRRCFLALTLEDQVGPAFPLARGTPGVEVAGGTWMVETERRDGSVHVALSEDGIAAEGWLPENCVGTLWSSDPYLAWPPPGGSPSPVFGDPVPVFLGPTDPVPIAEIVPLALLTSSEGGGRRITVKNGGVPLHPLGPVEGNRRLVLAQTSGLRVIGWIDAAIPIEPDPPVRLPNAPDPSGGTWIYADSSLHEPLAYALPGADFLPREPHGRAREVVFSGPDGVTHGYIRR